MRSSTNGGSSWGYLSTIDEKNGAPGSLGNPDKGVYEPHMMMLPMQAARSEFAVASVIA
ncbi:hypothetical protein [Paenibacillus alginolyticus]|uniref:Uncharacterized protein n=1 Tax=Paenibacillus alginolyticus TaxID=59839 RepID=A0ABT4GGA3_9BACL|nr:hypothetical protein [Paenibacillus alginolyticus]MCY9695109.1 hypothetical protein [Paenibacillus alginolyticus]MEC0147958.1 hypothetical protein [Paenibacillus alginolyticus]